jgi:hypothetical protein
MRAAGGPARTVADSKKQKAPATDVTLAELTLEAFLPADEATAGILRKRLPTVAPRASPP